MFWSNENNTSVVHYPQNIQTIYEIINNSTFPLIMPFCKWKYNRVNVRVSVCMPLSVCVCVCDFHGNEAVLLDQQANYHLLRETLSPPSPPSYPHSYWTQTSTHTSLHKTRRHTTDTIYCTLTLCVSVCVCAYVYVCVSVCGCVCVCGPHQCLYKNKHRRIYNKHPLHPK